MNLAKIKEMVGLIGLVGGFIMGIIILIIVFFSDMIIPIPSYVSYAGIIIMVMYGLYLWHHFTKSKRVKRK